MVSLLVHADDICQINVLSQMDTFTFWANICIYSMSNTDNDGCYSCVVKRIKEHCNV